MIKKIGLILFFYLIFIDISSARNVSNLKERFYLSNNIDSIQFVFQNRYDTVQTSVYWYWISDHLSKEGVVKDLQAMKAVGINRAFIGNIGLDNIPFGKVKIFSDEWWGILHTALKTASDLNIEIGIFNSPGWSQSGGPWVKPEQSMRYLHKVDTVLVGGKSIEGLKLQVPSGFMPVKTLAHRIPNGYGITLTSDDLTKLTSTPYIADLKYLFDQNNKRGVSFSSNNDKIVISVDLKRKGTFRSLHLSPDYSNGKFLGTLEVFKNGEYQEVRSFKVDRRNTEFNVGFEKFAPVVVSFPAVEGQEFRLVISSIEGTPGLRRIAFSEEARIDYYKEKTLAKMHPTPSPSWGDYLWPSQEEETAKGYYLYSEEILDLTNLVNQQGELNWNAPAGKWKIMSVGMVPTGVTNGPATKEGTGLEVDKMNHRHVIKHFDAFLGEIKRRIPEADRKTWKVAVQDSYETGSQNWTDGFETTFINSFGYNPTPYIPAMFGYVVDSKDKSDRFLWDLRRFIADRIAYEYVGGLRDISHKHGLSIWLENYGHWGFPGEFLQYGGQSDEIGGEFWNEGELGDIENKAASSAAHIYGKKKVSAESFTSAGNTYGRYPALLKARADRFFTEGINSTLLHVYIHQPYEDKKPGVNTWFGTEFNRHNTWFYYMDDFLSYLKRCNYVLQQGIYVADIAYYIGEDVPKMTGIQNPKLPKGFSFDYINSEVIINRMDVKDGKFILPDGLEYKVLVLPDLESMRPEVLLKIQKLIEKGGVVLGKKPLKSPSLSNYPVADQQIQEVGNEIWEKYSFSKKREAFESGIIFENQSLEYVFNQLDLLPDFSTKEDSILFIHRKLNKESIYFISNQKSTKRKFSAQFRVEATEIELWNPVNGLIVSVPFSLTDDGCVEVELELDITESCFVVFRNDKKVKDKTRLKTERLVNTLSLDEDWKVSFNNDPRKTYHFSSLQDWSKSDTLFIKYFSGAATYSKNISYSKASTKNKVRLNLGKVYAIAKVKVNNQYVGGVWTYPYSLDITSFLKNGDNLIQIEVINTWVNALIGDKKSDEEQKLWLLEDPYKKEDQLHRAGLFGPVSLELYK